MEHVGLHNLNKFYGQNHVVKNVSLEVQKGEFLTLLGPSGCGKSTTLRMIAGFEVIDSGQVLIHGRDVSNVPANRRGIGMVFQSYALFPNMTALDNVGFGLKMQKLDARTTRGKARKILAEVGLESVMDHLPHQLSGGQQQRVALARAIVREPEVLLLDEPLSALDAKIRIQLRELIKDLQIRRQITTIYVTHDQEEALSISDRIAVMNQGVIVQLGAPNEIYARPADPFVATFVGTLNKLPGQVVDTTTGMAEIAGHRMTVPALIGRAGRVTLGVRPEKIRLYAGDANLGTGEAIFSGVLKTIALFGSVVRITVLLGESEVKIDMLNKEGVLEARAGSEVRFGVPVENLLILN